jgi:hypothetical protein
LALAWSWTAAGGTILKTRHNPSESRVNSRPLLTPTGCFGQQCVDPLPFPPPQAGEGKCRVIPSRSRNASRPAPPPRIRTCGVTAYGSCLGS